MWNRGWKLGLGLLLGAAAMTCLAQDVERGSDKVKEKGKADASVKVDTSPPSSFRLVFVVKEVDGNKVLNARTYAVLVSTAPDSGGSSIRTEVKVPDVGDVGVRIDCRRVRVMENQLALNVTANVSGLPENSGSPSSRPIIRQNIWSSDVLIPMKHPVTIFSSDSTTSKTQTQLELTATPVP